MMRTLGYENSQIIFAKITQVKACFLFGKYLQEKCDFELYQQLSLQIFCKTILYSYVIVKGNKDPDNNFQRFL